MLAPKRCFLFNSPLPLKFYPHRIVNNAKFRYQTSAWSTICRASQCKQKNHSFRCENKIETSLKCLKYFSVKVFKKSWNH